MVKCLIRIKTKVNVHLRMINYCYRDVKVRVLTLGPRLLGKVLGALPLAPPLPSASSSETSSTLSLPLCDRPCRAEGLESLRDSGHSTPVRSVSGGDPLVRSQGNGVKGGNRAAEFSEESYSPSHSMLPTPVSSNCSLDQTLCRHTNGPPRIYEEEESEAAWGSRAGAGPRGRPSRSGKVQPSSSMEVEQMGEVIGSLARLFAVTLAMLLALLLLLIALTESELDMAFLRDIRRTPEFQQFHYEYFCPLRRWLACKLRWMGGHLINK